MQTPRFVLRRSKRYPAMFGVLTILAFFWLGFPSALNAIRSLKESPVKIKGSGDLLGSLPHMGQDDNQLVESSKSDEDMKEKAEEVDFAKKSVQEDNNVNYLDPKLDDPMSSFMVGFPLEPLSLDALKLCDPEQTIMLGGSYKCTEDHSCLKCTGMHQIERFRELIGAYRNPELEAARKAKIKSEFAGQHTIVMFTFNFAHSDLFLNWACSAQKLGMDVKAFTLVIPCDDKATELVKKLGFRYIDPGWQRLLSRPIKSQESFWGQDHADINNVALFSMLDVIDLGFHVFVHDADVAWIRDPFPFFKNAIRRRDFLGMLAPFWNSMGPVNTGLLYIAPTLQMRIFLKSMENAAIIKGTSDQKLWNAVLRHFVFQQLEWRLLPQAVVYKYSGRQATPPDHRALLMHALGTNKREKLSRFNLWLLNPSCPFYDAESAALSERERTKNTEADTKKAGKVTKTL